MRQQCPELEIETVDLAMCEELHTNEDAPAREEGEERAPNVENGFAYITRVTEVSAADVGLGPTLDRHYSDVGIRHRQRPTLL